MSYLLSSRKHGRKGLKVKIPVYPCIKYKATEPDSKPADIKTNTPIGHITVYAGSNWRT